MSQVGATLNLQAGVASQLTPPQDGQLYKYVVLQNKSPFPVQVNIANVLSSWLQPDSADVFELPTPNSALTLTSNVLFDPRLDATVFGANNIPIPTPYYVGTVTSIWYLTTEPEPPGYPSPLTAQDEIPIAINVPFTTIAYPVGFISGPFFAIPPGAGLLIIQWTDLVAGKTVTILGVPSSAVYGPTNPLPYNQPQPVIVYAITSDQSIEIATNTVNNQGTLTVFALQTPPPALGSTAIRTANQGLVTLPLVTDFLGRLRVVPEPPAQDASDHPYTEMAIASVNGLSGGTNTVLAAPGAGFRYRYYLAQCDQRTSGVSAVLQDSSGTPNYVSQALGATTAVTASFGLSGVPAIANHGLNVIQGTGTVDGLIVYSTEAV